MLQNYYRVDPLQQDYADKVLNQAANKIYKDLFSNLGLQVTNAWLKAQGQPLGRFRDCSEMYLTAEEYGHEQSKKHKHPRTKNASHKLGGDGYHRKAQRMVARTGEKPNAVDMYIMAHRGADPTQPEVLCTPLATERLEEYEKEMVRHHGEGFDWKNAPIDPQAVYNSGGGKSHGRFAMFNGMIDSREIQRGSSSHSSDGSSSHQRRTTSDMEIESMRQEIQRRDAFFKVQEEYQKL
ncbi:hypothetical protein U9M48_001355 [Paspalum notatum var. saurae]|uniref:Uncharacterized protein n=1 Tax=Paspalum notatum var. saurae TaxID=547442 RepID=A0AAQ3PND8_PASNO